MLPLSFLRRRDAASTSAGDRLPCGRRRDRLRRHHPLADPRASRPGGDVGRARGARRSRSRGAGECRGLPGGCGPRRGRRPRVPRRVHAVHRRDRQGGVRGAQARRARPRAHPHARRPAPGPSARLRAHVEHVPRSPDPRVRGSEVGRRPRDGRTSTSRSTTTSSSASSTSSCATSPPRQGKHWYDEETFRGLMRLRGPRVRVAVTVRRGVLRSQGRSSATKRLNRGSCAYSSQGATATSDPFSPRS